MMRSVRPFLLLAVIAFSITLLTSQEIQARQSICKSYPLKKMHRPASEGWSKQELASIETILSELHSAAFMLLDGGKIVYTYGDVTRDYNIHSIRKSFLTALIGRAVSDGQIDLNADMASLNVDDFTPLTEREKTATFRDLISARSGIYLPAAYETAAMAAARPARGSHSPGENWYYNNWDFNVAGRLYERLSGKPIHAAFAAEIAIPLCMQDYDPGLMRYVYEDSTRYPAYPFRMSTRDLALFGQLHLQDGVWNGSRILPAGWVTESTTPISETGRNGTVSGYGYMWWVTRQDSPPEGLMSLPVGGYTANGAGGHRIAVLPGLGLVVVNRMDTDNRNGKRLSSKKFDRLLRKVVHAKSSR